MNENCSLCTKNGLCKKWDARHECKPSNEKWFSDKLNACDLDEVCLRSSIFGNRYFEITMEDIQDLIEGKVLYYVGEYGYFLYLYDKEKEDYAKRIKDLENELKDLKEKHGITCYEL